MNMNKYYNSLTLTLVFLDKYMIKKAKGVWAKVLLPLFSIFLAPHPIF